MRLSKRVCLAKKLAVAVLIAGFSSTSHALIINFDYSLDANNFFSDVNRKNALDSAASIFETFTDNLTAINAGSGNDFTVNIDDPSTANPYSQSAFSVAANTLTIFVGARDLTGSTLGVGGPGGFSCSGFGSFCADADSRGQGATSGLAANDFGPWGGSIAFDSLTNWYFGEDVSGLNNSLVDFKSVAIHELGHVFGFGTSDSFAHLLAGQPNISGGHFVEGTSGLVNGVPQETAMDPTIFFGQRKLLTDVDLAAFRTIGWNVPVTAVPEPSSYAMLFFGLALLFGRRKNKVNESESYPEGLHQQT